MRKLFICLAVIMALTMIGGRAFAAVFGDDGYDLQGALGDITVAPNPGVSSVNVKTDDMSDNMDSLWSIHGSGGSVNTVIIELAAWAGTNTAGVYDAANHMNKVQLFGGAATTGTQVTLGILTTGEVAINSVPTGTFFASGNLFGFYLDATVGAGEIWYSDTSLNADDADHMYAYQGKNIDMIEIDPWSAGLWSDDEYVFAFEDLPSSSWDWAGPPIGDPDYSDFVFIAESIKPIPEPGTLLLLGLGLISVVGLKRKKFMG